MSQGPSFFFPSNSRVITRASTCFIRAALLLQFIRVIMCCVFYVSFMAKQQLPLMLSYVLKLCSIGQWFSLIQRLYFIWMKPGEANLWSILQDRKSRDQERKEHTNIWFITVCNMYFFVRILIILWWFDDLISCGSPN